MRIRAIVDRDTDAKLLEFSENAPVPPPCRLGHLEDEVANLLRLPGPAPRAGRGLHLALADPAGKCPGMDDGNQLLDREPKSDAQLGQLRPFRWRHVDPFGQLAP